MSQRYITMVRSASVSGRRRNFGPYKYVAVVELDPAWAEANPGAEPAMITTRARGIRRIVRESDALYAGGRTQRSDEPGQRIDLGQASSLIAARIGSGSTSGVGRPVCLMIAK